MIDLRINNGIIRGMREQGFFAFKGIPYAKSPIGKLRFLPPEPCEDWFGALDCSRYGARPIQVPPPWCLDSSSSAYEECCLNLNIWTPELDDKRRPVFFNIFGGGFMEGSNSELGSEGCRLLKERDIVIVAPNYRVGAVGSLYLGHHLGNDYAVSGSVGMLDQILALKWVQQNITLFGGDPDHVIIVGQSAGAKSVMNLLVAPEANGLFHGAVAMSGALQGIKDIDTEVNLTRNFLSAMGLEEKEAEKLLTCSAEEILKAQEAANKVYFKAESYGPTADGIVFPENIENSIKRGNIAKVPVIMGHAKQELWFQPDMDRTDIGMDAVKKKLRWKFGDNSEHIFECYKNLRETMEYPEAYGTIATNFTYTQAYLRTAALLAEQNVPLWLYRWDYTGGLIANHSSDNEALFGRTSLPKQKWNPEITSRVDRYFRDAILNFVVTGNPSADNIPEWEPYHSHNKKRMLFDASCSLVDIDLSFDPIHPLQTFKLNI